MKHDIVSLAQLFSQSGIQALPVDTLDIHPSFHTDEGAGYWLATSKSFHEKVELKLPGISFAKITTWGLGQALPSNEKANVVSLGCRGGRADEHTLRGAQFQKTCAAKIFAGIAGLNDDQALDRVLDRVIREDRHGASNGESIHAVLKQIHRMQNPPELPIILEWTCLVYEAQYQTYKKDTEAMVRGKVLTLEVGREMITDIFSKEKADQWFDLGRRAMRNHKEREERMLVKLCDDKSRGEKSEYWSSFIYGRVIKDADGNVLNIRDEDHQMVVIETKSMEVQRPAMKLGASLVVIKSLDGRIAIFTDKMKKIDLSLVALALRQEELDMMRDAGDHFKGFDPRALQVRGHVTGWPAYRPYWFLQDVPRVEANQLYCGSESACLVPSSQIPLERIVKILKLVLGRNYHPHFYKKCLKGKCSGFQCSWFNWRLVQCGIAQGKVKLASENSAQAPKELQTA